MRKASVIQTFVSGTLILEAVTEVSERDATLREGLPSYADLRVFTDEELAAVSRQLTATYAALPGIAEDETERRSWCEWGCTAARRTAIIAIGGSAIACAGGACTTGVGCPAAAACIGAGGVAGAGVDLIDCEERCNS